MFGLSMDKIIILAVIAAFLIGPSRIPAAAAALGRSVRSLRAFVDTAKDRARQELGEDFVDIEWTKLDPRRYDPRRIIADALLDPAGLPVRPPRAPGEPVADGDEIIDEPTRRNHETGV